MYFGTKNYEKREGIWKNRQIGKIFVGRRERKIWVQDLKKSQKYLKRNS